MNWTRALRASASAVALAAVVLSIAETSEACCRRRNRGCNYSCGYSYGCGSSGYNNYGCGGYNSGCGTSGYGQPSYGPAPTQPMPPAPNQQGQPGGPLGYAPQQPAYRSGYRGVQPLPNNSGATGQTFESAAQPSPNGANVGSSQPAPSPGRSDNGSAPSSANVGEEASSNQNSNVAAPKPQRQ